MRRYVHQYDEEYDAVKKTRRAGRPASTKEDLLKIKITALEKEYDTGFCEFVLITALISGGDYPANNFPVIPDITSAESVKQLDAWEGSWAYLANLPWIKVTAAGNVRKAELPSKAIV